MANMTEALPPSHTSTHRTAPHRTAPHRTAPHRTAKHATKGVADVGGIDWRGLAWAGVCMCRENRGGGGRQSPRSGGPTVGRKLERSSGAARSRAVIASAPAYWLLHTAPTHARRRRQAGISFGRGQNTGCVCHRKNEAFHGRVVAAAVAARPSLADDACECSRTCIEGGPMQGFCIGEDCACFGERSGGG